MQPLQPTPDPDVGRRLIQRRQAAAARLAEFEAEFTALVRATTDSNTDDEHDPEGATVGYERAQLSAAAARARKEVEDVNATLARWRRGTDAICEQCGGSIAAERRAARPTARTCITCARR